MIRLGACYIHIKFYNLITSTTLLTIDKNYSNVALKQYAIKQYDTLSELLIKCKNDTNNSNMSQLITQFKVSTTREWWSIN